MGLLFSLLLAATTRSAHADSVVVFNEIMYHPPTNEAAQEWLELHNQMAVDVDLSGWSLTGGIDFPFAEGTIIPGGGYLVVAASPADLMTATGLTNVLGPFAGRLSNAGEKLELHNNNGRLMDSVTYGVAGDWPVGPDGSGVSLAKREVFYDVEVHLQCSERGRDDSSRVGFTVRLDPDHPLRGVQNSFTIDRSGGSPGPKAAARGDRAMRKRLSARFGWRILPRMMRKTAARSLN